MENNVLKRIKSAKDCRSRQIYKTRNGKKHLHAIEWISPSLGLTHEEIVKPETKPSSANTKSKTEGDKE